MPQDEKPKLDVEQKVIISEIAIAKIAANLRPRFPKNQEIPTDEEIVEAVREYSKKHKGVNWKDLTNLLDNAEFLDEISKGILALRAFEEEAALIGPLVPEVPGQERAIPKERPHALPEEPRMAIRDKDEEPEPVIPDIRTTQKSPEVGIMPYGTRAAKPVKPAKPVVKPVVKPAANPAAEQVRHAEMRLPEQREIRRVPITRGGEKLRMAEPVQKRTRPRRTTEEEMSRQQEAQAQQQEQQEYEEMRARASMQAAMTAQQPPQPQERKGFPTGVAGGITGAAAAIILGGAAKAANAATSFYFLQKIIDIIT